MNKGEFSCYGHTFKVARNLTLQERAFENLDIRMDYNTIHAEGYTHEGFYEIAEQHEAVTDLYIMDGTLLVIPTHAGFCKYTENQRLVAGTIYFSQCCGKIVRRREAGEGYECPRCRGHVTRYGGAKK